jgi:hypothetical protein
VFFWLRDVFHPSWTAGGRKYGTTLPHIMEGHEHRAKKFECLWNSESYVPHYALFFFWSIPRKPMFFVPRRRKGQAAAVLSWKKSNIIQLFSSGEVLSLGKAMSLPATR